MAGIQMQILGSGTCVPSLERGSCSALVRGGGALILIDVGPGTMGRLLAAGVGIDEIDVICLTHFHPDHCGELAAFIFSSKYPVWERTKPLTLVGGAGVTEFWEKLGRVWGSNLEMPEGCFRVIELGDEGVVDLGFPGLGLAYGPVNHKPESRAFRFTDGEGFSMVYSGDTDESPELEALASGADVLVIEASTPDGEKAPGHLTPSLAGEIARRAGVGQVVLTHIYPQCEGVDMVAQCRQKYPGPVRLARDLMMI